MKSAKRGLKMEKKSSKMVGGQSEGLKSAGVCRAVRSRRFVSAYDKLALAIKQRFDADGDAVSYYVGRLGAVAEGSYRDELMIKLVRCREIRNKFTRGEISQLEYAISEDDIAALLSLRRRVLRLKDPVSCHERGIIISKLKRYSSAAVYVFCAALIFLLSVALFFAIKY